MSDGYVYRLIGIYSGKPERKIYSRFQLSMKFGKTPFGSHVGRNYRIERAPLGAWQDVTSEMVKQRD